MNGRLVAAAQEERFSRKKHDARFPRSAVSYCLATGGIIALLFGLLIPWMLRRPFPSWPWIVMGGLPVLWVLVAPATLRPFHRRWMRFGSLLNGITMPIILSIIYLIVITPIGSIMRLRGKDPMARKFDKRAHSYRVPSRKIINKNMERPF